MTKSEAYDAIAQAGPLLASLEKIIRQAMAVLNLPDELIDHDLKIPADVEIPKKPILKVVSTDKGDPGDWKWDKTIYGDD